MKILIADDDLLRANKLSTYLATALSIHNDDISVAESYDEAKAFLKAIYFDVLILDVVLPKRKGQIGTSKISLSLIDQLSRSGVLKKPEKIIGITAHSGDLLEYKSEFERHCLLVIEALQGDASWRDKIATGINQTGSSKISRVLDNSRISVVTIHGIATYGHWQDRLRRIFERNSNGIIFSTYKYGWFPIPFFVFSNIRNNEVEKLRKRMSEVISLEKTDHAYIFCHSFGTFLAAKALRKFLSNDAPHPQITLVLAGSVLPSEFDWSFLPSSGLVAVINDCGADDNVLLVSEALVPGTGMAGRVGFYGFSTEKFSNRFFAGGHSHYFLGDEFIKTYWLPLLASKGRASELDTRTKNSNAAGFFNSLARLAGSIKSPLYIFLLITLAIISIKKILFN